MFTTLRSNSQNLNRIAAILSGVVLFIALAGMLGWVFDLHLLRTFLPGRVAMKFNTALGLFASGVALWSVSGRQHFRVPIVLYVCAAFITCLGALTLAEYVFKWNAGFDDLFFSESIESSRALFPGRMSPHSAATFCFCGVAFLFFFSRARWQRFLFWTTLTLAAFVALVALAGHFYGALYLYAITSVTGMAVHTAVGFLTLCAGLFCAQNARANQTLFFSDTTGGVLARRLIPAAITIPLFLGWLRVLGQNAALYDSATGEATLVVSLIVVFTALITVTARKLRILDLARRDAEISRDRTIAQLQKALQEIRTLRGLLPMCAWCKRIRDDEGYWSDVAIYIAEHTDANVSHGMCPDCAESILAK